MWIVIYLSQSKDKANKVKEILQNAGLLVKIRTVSQSSSENYGCYEILVPESEVDEAHALVIDKLI